MNSPRVSVIVLNWNGAPHLAACLDSVQRLTYPERELMVVDNASTDGSAALIPPEFVRIDNPVNLGYAGGNNVGIRRATGAYVLLVNNDTVLDPGLIEPLVAAAEADPAVAAVNPKIVYFDRPEVINAAGLVIHADGSSGSRGMGEPDGPRYAARAEVFGAHGACVLYRRAALDRVGLFDEEFFAYNEEFDLAWRLRLAGFRALYVPEARVRHREAASLKRTPDRILHLLERNRVWCVAKNMSARQFVRHLPQLLAAEWAALRHCVGIRTLTPFRARLAALAGLPRMLARRRAVQALRAVPDADLERWFDSGA